jgi:uncharacterized membrane protein
MSNRDKKERRLVKQADPAPPAGEFGFLAAFRKGPLPPPAEMEKYELIFPGATKVLFDNFIKQSDHRMELEKETIQGDNKRANTGQILSFISTIVLIAVAFFLFINNKDAQGIAAVVTAVAPTITAFITASISRRKEREHKRKITGN